MQSAFSGVLTGENCICIGTSLIQDHNPRLQPLFWPSFWVLIISADKSEEIQFIYSLLGWLKSLVTVDVLDKQTNQFQKSFGILLGILLSFCCCFIFIECQFYGSRNANFCFLWFMIENFFSFFSSAHATFNALFSS